MIQANQKQLVISMLMHSFARSERIRTMLRSSKRNHQEAFFNHIYEFSEQVGNIFLSKDNSTTLIYYRNSDCNRSLTKLWPEVKLLFTSLSWSNLRRTIALNRNVRRIRTDSARRMGDHDYIYVWFLAGRELSVNYKGLCEAMNHLREESHNGSLPIYMETVVVRMLPIYERAGFHFYDEYISDDQTIYFGKYSCHD